MGKGDFRFFFSAPSGSSSTCHRRRRPSWPPPRFRDTAPTAWSSWLFAESAKLTSPLLLHFGITLKIIETKVLILIELQNSGCLSETQLDTLVISCGHCSAGLHFCERLYSFGNKVREVLPLVAEVKAVKTWARTRWPTSVKHSKSRDCWEILRRLLGSVSWLNH